MQRMRQKLNLSPDECSIIKGLVEHTQLNDQMIVAIFSHLSRTINHREIGYFRDGTHKKYAHVSTASRTEVERFMARYHRFERIAKAHGLVPQEVHFQLVQKAAEAMKTSVGIFNNPQVRWKTEIYIVNAVIALTYLLHAYYMTKRVDYRYKQDGIVQLTEDGRLLCIGNCPDA